MGITFTLSPAVIKALLARRAGLRWAALMAPLLAFPLLACNTIATDACSWGMICPPGKVCHEPTRSCVQPTQQAACDGQPEWGDCDYPGASVGTHFCRDGLCVLALCGNGVLDPGEPCDGTQLLAQYCADIPGAGFQVGVAGCTADCTYDTRRCWTAGWSTLDTDDDRHLYAVGSTEAGLVIAAGLGSTVQTLDRATGRFVPLDGFSTICEPGNERLLALDLNAAGDRLMLSGAGCQAYVVHLDGARVVSCQKYTVCEEEPNRLMDVWALPDHSKAWVPSSSNRLYQYRDATEDWTVYEFDPGVALRSIWGRSESEIYATGDDGLVLRFDGLAWAQMAQDVTDDDLHSVWGPSDGSGIYVVGWQGSILHFDGNGWQDLDRDRLWTGGLYWRKILGIDAQRFWLVGQSGMVGYFNGAGWLLEWISDFDLQGISLTGSGAEVLIVGMNGTAMRYRGQYWTQLGWEDAIPRLNAAAMLPDGSVAAAGEAGILIKRHGSSVDLMAPQGFVPDSVKGLWAGTQSVLGVGTDGAICALEADQWGCDQIVPGVNFTAISGREVDGVVSAVAVGSAGAVYWYDDLGWERDIHFPSEESLFGVWMDPDPDVVQAEVFAVGLRGAVWRFSAGQWYTEVAPGTSPLDLYAVTGDPSRVVAVGDAGVVVQLDRVLGQWATTSVGLQPFFAVWAPPTGTEFFAIGQGSPAYFDGEAWSLMQPHPLCRGDPRGLWGLTGTSSRDVFAVGDQGCFFHFTGRLPAASSP